MKIEHSAQLTIKHDTVVEELQQALTQADVPGDAKINVVKYDGDQRDPGYTYLKFSWETGD